MIEPKKIKQIHPNKLIHILRNPAEWDHSYVREVRHQAANFIEKALKPFDCSKLHAMAQDKDDLCPHCQKPFNPNF